MAAIRTWVFGIVAWGAVAASATAAPMSWFGSQDELTAWYANRLHSAGNIYAPASGDTLSNYSSGETAASSSAQTESSSAAVMSTKGVPASSVASISSPPWFSRNQNWWKWREDGGAKAQEMSQSASPKPFINFGSSPYAEAASLVDGTPSPWYYSPAVTKVFGGVPDEARRVDFEQTVLANVEDTFRLSGLDLNLSTTPESPASPMISVVSGVSYKDDKNGDIAGITYVNSSGFSFIDKLNNAENPEQLALVLAHNVAHELMHTFGVYEHTKTSEYLDGERGGWDLMTNPDTKFSPEAVALMKPSIERLSDRGVTGDVAAQLLSEDEQAAMGPDFMTIAGSEAPVPEPSTIAVWTISGLFAGFTIRRRSARKNAS